MCEHKPCGENSKRRMETADLKDYKSIVKYRYCRFQTKKNEGERKSLMRANKS
jgi:hypothetical protein